MTLCLACALVVGLLSQCSKKDEDTVPAGTTLRPIGDMIPINTLEQLNAMRLDLNGDGEADDAADAATYAAVFPDVEYAEGKYAGYELARNLDFQDDASYSDATANKATFGGTSTAPGWTPIGTEGAPFTSTFDGGEHTITNLYINTSANGGIGLFGIDDRLGLFGTVNETIRNVGIVNPNVTGGRGVQIGGLAGVQNGGTISACYVSGATLRGGNIAAIGGLAGRQAGGTISACYVSGATLTGRDDVAIGGLAGVQNRGTISVCYVSGGTITGEDDVNAGGLIGYQAGTISACYVSGGTLTGGNIVSIGGLIGYQAGTISVCYVSGGTLTGGDDVNVGGLIGSQVGTISVCYVSGATLTGGRSAQIGGLVGVQNDGTISACYVSGGTIAGEGGTPATPSAVGGLVGWQNDGTISACYVSAATITGGDFSAVGSLSGTQFGTIIACYTGGRAAGEEYTNLRGAGSGTLTNSYYQAATTEDSDDATDDIGARTATELQTPTSYTEIYSAWDDLDGDESTDSETLWNFGTGSQYPVLNVDFNADDDTADDVTRQRN